jgi:hypothetical protein
LQATLNLPRDAKKGSPSFRTYMEQSRKFFVSLAGRAFYARRHCERSKLGATSIMRVANMALGSLGYGGIEGTSVLAGNDRKKSAPRIVIQADSTNNATRKPVNRSRDTNIGSALRSIYNEAVKESVPDEFLDLLSKLD